jgi:hypothetical protein
LYSFDCRTSRVFYGRNNYIYPVANCIFELINLDDPPKISFEEIGELVCEVDQLREEVAGMLQTLDRLQDARKELRELAFEGEISGGDRARFDEEGRLRTGASDLYGHEILS